MSFNVHNDILPSDYQRFSSYEPTYNTNQPVSAPLLQTLGITPCNTAPFPLSNTTGQATITTVSWLLYIRLYTLWMYSVPAGQDSDDNRLYRLV